MLGDCNGIDLTIKLYGMNAEFDTIAKINYKDNNSNKNFEIELGYFLKDEDRVEVSLQITFGKNHCFSRTFELTEEQIEKYGIEPEELRLPF